MKIIFLLFLPYLSFCINFRQTTTKHFKFIYDKDSYSNVSEYIDYSQDIFEKVSKIFSYYPKEKIPIVFRNSDSHNGMFNPLKKHIEILLSPPDEVSYGKSYKYVTLIHELVHYIHLTQKAGFAYSLSKVFGPDIVSLPGAFYSGAITEGIATYLETFLTDSGRGREPEFNMWIKSKLLYYDNGFYRNSRQGPVLNSDIKRNYAFGYIIIQYIIENYGLKKFIELDRYYKKFPLIGEQLAILKVLGLKTDMLFNKAMEYQKKKYSSNIKDGRVVSKTKSPSSNWLNPVFLDNGKTIMAFSQNQNYSVALYNNFKKEKNLFTNTSRISMIAADKKGKNIFLLKSFSDIKDFYPRGLLSKIKREIVYVKGKKSKILTKNKHINYIDVSDNGKYIVGIVSDKFGYHKLVQIGYDGKTHIIYKNKNALLYHVFIGSKHIVFVEKSKKTNYQNEIIMLNYKVAKGLIKTSKKTYITNSNYIKMHPKIKGDNVYYAADYNQGLSYYCYNLKTKQSYFLANDKIGILDGYVKKNKLYYYSMDNYGHDIKVKIIRKRKINLKKIQNKNIFDKKLSKLKIKNEQESEKKFYEFSYPNIWYPNLSLKSSYQNVGLSTRGFSYLNDQSFVVSLFYKFPYNQIETSLLYSISYGIFKFSYNLSKTYIPFEKLGLDDIKNSFMFSFDPSFEDSRSIFHSFSLGVYLIHAFLTLGTHFEFYNQYNSKKISSNAFDINPFFYYSLQKTAYTSYIFNLKYQFFLQSLNLFKPPVFSVKKMGFKTVDTIGVTLPAWFFAIKTSFNMAYAHFTSASIQDIIPYKFYSGIKSDLFFSSNTKLVFPLVVVDEPVLNFNIQKITFNFLFDTGFYYDGDGFGFIDAYYIGGSFDLNISLNMLPFVLSIGTIFYLDTDKSRELFSNFNNNMQIFFSLGTQL